MKYIKSFESNNKSLEIWTKDIIEKHFEYVFDNTKEYSIELGSFDDNNWYSGAVSLPYDDAYLVELSHDFFDNSSIEEFLKYKKMLDELEIALLEIKSYLKPSYIGFQEDSNDRISIIIKP